MTRLQNIGMEWLKTAQALPPIEPAVPPVEPAPVQEPIPEPEPAPVVVPVPVPSPAPTPSVPKPDPPPAPTTVQKIENEPGVGGTSTVATEKALTPYDIWKADPTPDNLGKVVDDLESVIVREVYKYSGPSELLHAKAKEIVIEAIQSYDPSQGTQLSTWVTTQLQQLNRYGQQVRPVYNPEVSAREAAELNTIVQRMTDELGREPTIEEIADEAGMTPAKVQRLQSQVVATVSEGQLYEDPETGMTNLPAVDMPSLLGEAADVVYPTLDPIDKQIFDYSTGRYGGPPLSKQEIAEKLGMTTSAVSQRAKSIAQRILEMQKNVQ